MKKILLPFQNMVRADLFSGSLAVWNVLGFAFYFARPPIPSRAKRGENRIPFELFLEYTANWNFARKKAQPRPAKGGARQQSPKIRILKIGGGGEIRTHGAFRHTAFQVRRDRPLCHPSVT